MKEILFNGKIYKKYKGEKYFTIGNKKLHREVYEFHNGTIPKGMHIHHVDFDKTNNKIENLIMLTPKDHLKIHENAKTKQQKQQRREHLNKIREKTKKWHKSEEGKRWHREHFNKNKDKIQEKALKKCICCGKEVEMLKSGKFCSNKCKSKHRRESGVDNVERICECCGKKFTTNKYSKSKVCSQSCSNRMRKRVKI